MNGPRSISSSDPPGDGPAQPRRASLDRLAGVPIHPLAIALYPILTLIAWNIQEIYLFQTVRSLVAALALAGALWALLTILLRDLRKAALLTSLSMIAFFSYGHLYNQVEDLTIGSLNLGRHRYLVPALGLALLAAWIWVMRENRRIAGWTRAFNFLGGALLLVPCLSIAAYLSRPEAATEATTRIPDVHLRVPKDPPPDIIYIVLDSYARSDYMTDAVGYDNQAFLDFLEEQGFYVAERSRATHNHTALSLSASLNMTPAQFLGVRMVTGDYPEPFAEPIRNSLVRRSLEGIGYDTISLRSGYRLTEFPDAAVFLSPDNRRVSFGARPNAFEDTLLRTTLLQPLIEAGWINLSPRTHFFGSNVGQREILLAAFKELEDLPQTGRPRFVFAHLMALHAPFLFDRDGNPLETNAPLTFLDEDPATTESVRQYREQAVFISERTEAMIRELLADESRPPVIIVQGDTGAGVIPAKEQRAAILNAILIDARCRHMLYPTITPVNTFRVIFNCYFDAGLELAPDDVYESPWPKYAAYRFDVLPPEAE